MFIFKEIEEKESSKLFNVSHNNMPHIQIRDRDMKIIGFEEECEVIGL